MTGSEHYRIPQDPNSNGSLVLALLVHLALLGFLWVGVSWQSSDQGGVEAEIWDIHYREAAPRGSAAPDVAEPEDTVKPRPQEAERIAKADIALKQRKEEAKKKADEEKQHKLDEKKRKKAEAEKKKKEAEDKRKQAIAERKALEKFRANELRRIAGATGSGGRGTAERSTGDNRRDPSYASLIRTLIRSNTTFIVPNNLDGNPAVEYAIELWPDGTLRTKPVRKKSSGILGFDEAVLRAIEKSEPFPPDSSGKVPSRLHVIHKPKD